MMPKPVMGCIQRNALGGGPGLADICDVTIGVNDVMMGLTETRPGLIPTTIGSYVAARIGPSKARAVVRSGRWVDAVEVVPPDGLTGASVDRDTAVEPKAAADLSTAQEAVASTKALLAGGAAPIDDGALAAPPTDSCDRGEAAEGMDAFLQMRPPDWRSG